MNRTHLNVRCKPSTGAINKSSPEAISKPSTGAINKSSPEAISKPSTEAINTPRAHQHDALTQLGGSNYKPLVTTRFGRTVRPKAYYAEYTKPVYGHNILKLAQSLSAISIEKGESQNTILDTSTPLHLYLRI
ncbi:hypothetical protein K3495_g9113 [Podosphaera aphanis]|nr:hypothetical protein K3495_g9113 [Podosphaera aphanis]